MAYQLSCWGSWGTAYSFYCYIIINRCSSFSQWGWPVRRLIRIKPLPPTCWPEFDSPDPHRKRKELIPQHYPLAHALSFTGELQGKYGQQTEIQQDRWEAAWHSYKHPLGPGSAKNVRNQWWHWSCSLFPTDPPAAQSWCRSNCHLPRLLLFCVLSVLKVGFPRESLTGCRSMGHRIHTPAGRKEGRQSRGQSWCLEEVAYSQT